MKSIFSVIAVLLGMAWILSFFILRAGSATHLLLVLSIFFWLHSIISTASRKKVPDEVKQ
jgi:hypothetical protein